MKRTKEVILRDMGNILGTEKSVMLPITCLLDFTDNQVDFELLGLKLEQLMALYSELKALKESENPA